MSVVASAVPSGTRVWLTAAESVKLFETIE